jgi:hypothetical protein
MSSNRERRISALSLDQKIGSRVSERWFPMKQALGKNADGSWKTADVWVDMRSGRDGGEKTVAYHEDGWNGDPPPLPSGDPGKAAAYQPPSQRYRENFTRIDWSK